MSAAVYVAHRTGLYAFLWAASVIELGLTGFRVHHTESTFGFHDKIVVELLVTAALTLLWVPFSIVAFRRRIRELRSGEGYAPLHFEGAGNVIVWIMWLVGAAIATHNWPTRLFAGPGEQGHILLTIVAFAWLNFIALTLAAIFQLMQYAALKASVVPAVEKA